MGIQKITKFYFLLFLLVSSGCLFHHAKNEQAVLPTTRSVSIGQVVDLSKIQKGGNLLIVPFRAGVGVEETTNLQKISLLIVKGISEVIEENNLPFTVLNASNAQSADLIMKGHVTRFSETGKTKKWLPTQKKVSFGIEGDIVDRETGNVILHFSHQKIAREKNEDIKSLALNVSRDVGFFIAEQFKP